MDEGESAAGVLRLRNECSGQARARYPRPSSAATRNATAAPATGNECARGRGAGNWPRSRGATSEDSLRAADSVPKGRTDGHPRRCGRERERPLFDPDAAAIQPRGPQCRRGTARRVPLRRDPGNCHCAARGQRTWPSHHLRNAPAEHIRGKRERDADWDCDQGARSRLIEPVDRAGECQRFAAEAHSAGNQRGNGAGPAVVILIGTMLPNLRIRRRVARRLSSSEAGMTLLELILACSILLILASAALPIAKYTVLRNKETELRKDLREMRDAIDRYKDAADRNQIRVEVGSEGYPPVLETLVKGVQLGAGSDRKIRFLRKIPIDPMTRSAEWGLRAVQDDPDSTSWGGKNVFDVYSKSTGTALDGTKYSDW